MRADSHMAFRPIIVVAIFLQQRLQVGRNVVIVYFFYKIKIMLAQSQNHHVVLKIASHCVCLTFHTSRPRGYATCNSCASPFKWRQPSSSFSSTPLSSCKCAVRAYKWLKCRWSRIRVRQPGNEIMVEFCQKRIYSHARAQTAVIMGLDVSHSHCENLFFIFLKSILKFFNSSFYSAMSPLRGRTKNLFESTLRK